MSTVRTRASMWSVAAMVCLIVVMLTSSASAATLRMMHWEHDQSTQKIIRQIADAFEKAYPGNKVEIEFIPVEQVSTKLIASVKTRSLPDVLQVMPEQLFSLIDANALLTLDDVVKAIGKDRFVEGVLNASTYKNHVYGVPTQVITWALWARKDLFAEAGIPYPKTWDELIAAAKKLTVDTNGDGKPERYGLALPYSRIQQAQEYVIAHLWQAGGNVFTPNLEIDFSKGAVETFEHYLALKPYMPPSMGTVTYADLGAIYANGDAAMVYYPGRITSHIERINPALAEKTVALEPPFEKRSATWNWTKMLVATKGKNQKLAKEFVKFFMRPENLAVFSSTVPIHSIPTLKDVYQHPTFANNPLNKKYAAALEVEQSILKHARDASYEHASKPNPYYAYVSGSFIISDMLQDVMIKGVPPTKAVANGVARMKQLLADVKGNK